MTALNVDLVLHGGFSSSFNTPTEHTHMATRYLAGLIGLVVLTATPAWAAPINYGSYLGTTVQFDDITADDGVMIGAPTVNGDSVEFTPRIASGASGGATHTIENVLTFGLAALPGFVISEFWVAESGIKTLGGSGTDLTTAIGGVTIQLTIDEVDGNPITPVAQNFIINHISNLVAQPGENPWNLAFGLDIDQILGLESVPFEFGATHLMISVTNKLTTTSEDGSFAQITKDALSVSATTIPTTAVPEPSSLCLVGLGVMTAYRRMRRSA